MAEFRDALRGCRRVYTEAAKRAIAENPQSVGDRDAFTQKMDDLHRALLVKIYVSVTQADRRWSSNERLLAEILFQHVWGRNLNGEPLREAVREVAAEATNLRWYTIVRPFERIAGLEEFVSELDTVVMRTANILARADGKPCEANLRMVANIQHEIDTHLRPIPLDDEPTTKRTSRKRRVQADDESSDDWSQEVARARADCKLEELPSIEDEAAQQKSREEQLREAMEELDGLIGLTAIKQEMQTLINFLKVQEHRKKANLPTPPLSLHMVFTGNPGTGKTTVARIVGRILGALGVLAKGHVIETDRSGLVAEYAGQTGPKTNKQVDEALDGVLFVDEAYTLVAAEGEDPYGHEAVQTLLKRMEDDRDRLVVILAGYSDEMRELLRSNPGLSSRFGRQLHFDDYSAREMCEIFDLMCGKNKYSLPSASRMRLMAGFQWMVHARDKHFGNGRTARNLFEHAIRRLANRIALKPEISLEHLTTIDAADLEFNRAGDDAWQVCDIWLTEAASSPQVRFECPKCGSKPKAPASFLGQQARCRKCDTRFEAAWGEVLHPLPTR